METGKIRILYFEPSTGFGGSARCLQAWLKHLDKSKFHPFMLHYFEGPAIKAIKEAGINAKRIPYISYLKIASLEAKKASILSYCIFMLEFICNIIPSALIIALFVKFKGIHLIDANTSIISAIPAILASRISGKPCICHIHDTRPLTSKEVFFAKFANKFIVLTEEARNLYSGKIDPEKITVLYNGIDTSLTVEMTTIEKIKGEFGIESELIVGMVGRITKGKGQDDFIKAAKLVVDSTPKVKFLIVGGYVVTDKNLEKELKSFAEKSGLKDYVYFTGWRNDVNALVSVFDISVLPSSTFPEGFPLTCIEAMALSKPVIATKIPGPSEIVEDGITGFLVPPSNPTILAEKISLLLKDVQLRKKMGAAGKSRAEALFDIKKLTKRLEEEYLKALNKGVRYD